MEDQVHTFISEKGDAWLPVPEVLYQMRVRSLENVTDFEQLAEQHAIPTSDLIAITGETGLLNQLMHYTWMSSKHVELVHSLKALENKFW